VFEDVEGSHRVAVYDVTLDTNYPTGGTSITSASVGLAITDVEIGSGNAGAAVVIPQWDNVNKKLQCFYPTGGAAPATATAPVAGTSAIPAGATPVTSTSAQPTLAAATLTGGIGVEVANATNLSAFKFRIKFVG
jgi:hypothetical protein